MHLKSLHIIGFKTFAFETEIPFDPGFTAVVGPNGSGKSNIVDSVKWVFGEKSAKGLRGEKMDDVIFHGTETRRPAGFAEVSILFDNSDRFFSLDYPTVKITRRLYPDGENEYYLNEIRSARKDIEKTLLDTGIGKSSYSILEQGRVDQILNSKPEERRLIFEEAAGVSRFKMERKEALRKLEDTKQNLLRVQDILRSMEKEMDIKEKQSEKAETYFRIKADFEETDLNLRYTKWKSYKDKFQAVESELGLIRDQNQALLSSIQSETNLIAEREREKEIKEKEVLETDKKLLDHLSRTQIQKEKIAKNKSFLEDYEERLAVLAKQIEDEETKTFRLDLDSRELGRELESIYQHIQLLDKQILAAEGEAEKKLLATKKEESNIQFRERELDANEKRHAELREAQKGIIYELIGELETKKKEALDSQETRERNKTTLIDWFQTIEEKLYQEGVKIASGLELEWSLQNLRTQETRELFLSFVAEEDRFRHLLFDKDGILSKKEAMDQSIEDLLLSSDNHTREIRKGKERIEELRSEWEILRNQASEWGKDRLATLGQEQLTKEKREGLLHRIKESQDRLFGYKANQNSLQTKKVEIEKEVALFESEIEKSYQEFLSMMKVLENQKETLQQIIQTIQNLKSNIAKNQEVFQTLLPKLSEKERTSSGLKVQIEALVEDLYNDYSLSESELDERKKSLALEPREEERKLKSLKAEIQMLGSINPLAIEEYRNTKEVYEHNKSQAEDIEASKKDIEEVLSNINEKSEKLFQETFQAISANFQETFSTLFQGGRATLELTEVEEGGTPGVEIMAEPPGKHVQNLRLLSGGEKSLTAIALLFAIYMVKPSPFCFLDEIDAALDEANKLRFCQILDRFKDKTQFIVVSHAQSTISRANAIFGVTNEEPGVSRIISLRLDDAKEFSKTKKREEDAAIAV